MMSFSLVLLLLLAVGTNSVPPAKIFAGEIDYSRIPVEYWQHRIRMVKGLGMNALTVNVMWNYHETDPGVFDFRTENHNLTLFLELTIKYNMIVLIRAGPYIGTGWDDGGIPLWLITLPIRTNNADFMAAVRSYWTALAPILKRYDSTYGGPIHLLQIQHEYGNFGNDLNYINGLRQIWKDLNVTIEQYHTDTAQNLNRSHWLGGNMCVSNGVTDNDYAIATKLDPSVYIFGEVSVSQASTWGGTWSNRSIDQIITQLTYVLQANRSFSISVAHGGTNFGVTAGAFRDSQFRFFPVITSYDNDAPIDQQGRQTPKYAALRILFAKYASWVIPDPPFPLPLIQIPMFVPTVYASLLENLGTPAQTGVSCSPFEASGNKMYHQGFMVYQQNFPNTFNETLKTIPCDYTLLAYGGQTVGAFVRHTNNQEFLFRVERGRQWIHLIVEAMGHADGGDFKGIGYMKDTNGRIISGWDIYKFPLNITFIRNAVGLKAGSYPVFGRYTFDMGIIGDTYFNMKNYVKGYVWINGRCLGRFWNVGPQFKLFCPAVWLQPKNNELIVMEMGSATLKGITGDTTLKLTPEEESIQ